MILILYSGYMIFAIMLRRLSNIWASTCQFGSANPQHAFAKKYSIDWLSCQFVDIIVLCTSVQIVDLLWNAPSNSCIAYALVKEWASLAVINWITSGVKGFETMTTTKVYDIYDESLYHRSLIIQILRLRSASGTFSKQDAIVRKSRLWVAWVANECRHAAHMSTTTRWTSAQFALTDLASGAT